MYRRCKKDDIQKYIHDRYCVGFVCPDHSDAYKDIHNYNIKQFMVILIASILINLIVYFIKNNMLFYTLILNFTLINLIINFDILMLFYSHYSKGQYVLLFMIIFHIDGIFNILYNNGGLFFNKDHTSRKLFKKIPFGVILSNIFVILYCIVMLNYLVNISSEFAVHVIYFYFITAFVLGFTVYLLLIMISISTRLYSKTCKQKMF